MRCNISKNFLKCKVIITDKKAIDKIKEMKKQGKNIELSCGYECDLVESKGHFDGQEYHGIQRNIKYNHLSIVDEGRAGSEVALKLDKKEIKKIIILDSSIRRDNSEEKFNKFYHMY